MITFAVEPHGDKLAVLYGVAPRIKLNLYDLKTIKGATADLLHTVNTRLMNHLSWSPRGQCLVLAAIKRLVCHELLAVEKEFKSGVNCLLAFLLPFLLLLPSFTAPRPPKDTWSSMTQESQTAPRVS